MRKNDYLPPRIKAAGIDTDLPLAVSLPGFGDGGSLNAKEATADEDHDAPGTTRRSLWE